MLPVEEFQNQFQSRRVTYLVVWVHVSERKKKHNEDKAGRLDFPFFIFGFPFFIFGFPFFY